MTEPIYCLRTDGVQEWRLDRKLHREDGPAIVYPDGSFKWFLNGLLHREDGPAVIHSGGSMEWYQNGKLHNPSGPAIIYPNGDTFWCINGDELYLNSKSPEWTRLMEIKALYDIMDE